MLSQEQMLNNSYFMRKTIISITVILLILSILGTGVLVYVETSAPVILEDSPVSPSISGDSL